MAAVMAESEVLVVGLSTREVAESLANSLRPDQVVIDLVNLPNRGAMASTVQGLCW